MSLFEPKIGWRVPHKNFILIHTNYEMAHQYTEKNVSLDLLLGDISFCLYNNLLERNRTEINQLNLFCIKWSLLQPTSIHSQLLPISYDTRQIMMSRESEWDWLELCSNTLLDCQEKKIYSWEVKSKNILS